MALLRGVALLECRHKSSGRLEEHQLELAQDPRRKKQSPHRPITVFRTFGPKEGLRDGLFPRLAVAGMAAAEKSRARHGKAPLVPRGAVGLFGAGYLVRARNERNVSHNDALSNLKEKTFPISSINILPLKYC